MLECSKVQSAVLQDNHLVWLDIRKFKALVTNKGVCMRVQKTAKIYEKVNKIFFTDEKNCLKCIILVTQNNRVFAWKKEVISDDLVLVKSSSFPKNSMISAGVSKLGKTSIFHWIQCKDQLSVLRRQAIV